MGVRGQACLQVYLNDVCLWVYVVRYVWETLDVGYIQGMCDLLAPLLVIFDDGTVSLFSIL